MIEVAEAIGNEKDNVAAPVSEETTTNARSQVVVVI